MKKHSIIKNFTFFRTTLFVIIILCLTTAKGYSQCASIGNNTISFTNGNSGQRAGTQTEGNILLPLTPPAATYFSQVNFASYGTPTGTSPNFTINPACHATTSGSITEGIVLGKATQVNVPANNDTFGDPCVNVLKKLSVVASYAEPICRGTHVTISGSIPTGGNGTFIYRWESSTTSAIAGFAAAAGTHNSQHYTSGALTQTTWFRRVVTSCAVSSTSTVVMVMVRPAFTAGAIAGSGQTICYNGTPTVIGSTTPASGGNGTISYSWRSSADGYVAAISGANNVSYTPPAGLQITTGYRRYAVDTRCNTVPTVSTNTWTVIVTPLRTAGAPSSTPTLCINTALTNITHATTGATGISNSGVSGANGLPAGVTAAWTLDTVTISGTPTVSGTFNYSIPLTGCGTASATGTITVNPLATAPNSASLLSLSIANATVSGTFTGASPAPTGYLIVRSLTATTFVPANGASYATGSTFGNYFIVRGTGTPSAATSFTNILPTNGVYYYSVFSFNNGCGSTPLYSTGTSANIKYVCSPTSTSSGRYIKNVQFVGTLSPDTTNPTGYSAGGYANYSTKSEKAVQIRGGAININFSAVAPANLYSNAKAWVDWNKDGIFETGELVYNSKGTGVNDLIFGYIVPTTATPGFYTIRLRTFSDQTFDACGSLSGGETEDYTFEVIDDCASKITNVTVSQQCGAGPVVLTATATPGTASYLWYKQEFGTPILGATSNIYTTESLAVGTHTYYVRAVGTSCQSVYYRPVKVVVSPTPTVQFTQTAPDICGYESFMKVTSSGDKQEVNLLVDNFDTFNNFLNVVEFPAAGAAESNWQLRLSPYVYTNILTPAVSSGYEGGKYAAIVTDKQRSANLLNHLTLKNSLNSTGYINLNLDFDLYYFSEVDNDTTRGYLKVDYSVDNGESWADIPTVGVSKSLFTEDYGIPTKWDKISIALPSELIGQTQLKFRISMFAYGGGAEYMANLAAVDNIRIYGDKTLNTTFSWNSDTLAVYTANCTDPYTNIPTSEVCIKPTALQMENSVQFKLTARANLNNGCYAEGELIIANNTRIWNNSGAVDNWSSPADWKPAGAMDVPTANKCVIIKTPVETEAPLKAFAKNVVIESTGQLTIGSNSSLTVTDALRNLAPATSVVVESDGNLIQINEGTAINSGSITAKRNINVSSGRQQYNYLISPLENQSLKTIYPGIDYVLYHNEANGFFYNSSGAYIKGRALAVKEPKAQAGRAIAVATFTGYPTNGAFTYGIVNSGTTVPKRGFNLIGNPYPSNLDLITFYELNKTGGTLSPTFHLWDNRANSQTVQMGDQYLGQAYAIFNAVTPPAQGTGTRAATGDPDLAGTTVPTRSVKVGQGFMVKTSAPTQQLIFNNTVRTDGSGTAFYGKDGKIPTVDRFWLNMITPKNLVSNIAVVYFAGGTNGFTQDDSPSLGGSDEVYSVVDGQKVTINGRSTFTTDDIVPLGSRHFEAGQFTIALAGTDGTFATEQSIYLKDKQTGIITNLSEGDYTFAANAGESTGRFEIAYKPGGVLATDSSVKEDLVVYKDQNDFVVISNGKKISSVHVFDAAGRLITTAAPNATKTVINSDEWANGVYILKIEREGEITSKKVIR